MTDWLATGDICILIHESIYSKDRKDLSISNNNSEELFIEITNKTRSIILGLVYTPPVFSLKDIKISLKQTFDNIRCNSQYLYLMGDFNINVLYYKNNVKVKSFIRFLNSLGPLINKPPTFVITNATAIAHILTSA